MLEATLYTLLVTIVFSIGTQSYNIALGYTGIFHLGHMGFYAIGAYTAALLSTHFGMPFLANLIISFIFAALAGFLIGIPAIRLKTHYLALATLGFGEIIRLIALNWNSLTNGPLGIDKIPNPNIGGWILRSTSEKFILYLIIGIIIHGIIYKIVHSPYGKILETIREDEDAAQALGKNTTKYKLQALALSAGFMGVAGAMYAHGFYNYINPTVFKIPDMIFIVIMLVTGGVGNFWGAIAGPVLIEISFELIRSIGNVTFAGFEVNIGAIRIMIYALIFMLIIIFRPNGLMGRRKPQRGAPNN